eukprot:gnl/TRDRNA2_/TRDRNA2_151591_c0_seq1.p1 gnl/TRDRNA2_/TRDRNA2_151591_c0~~gnl/TRDRNA2_/TRDRNA2_151591_c0_seq1.p1  ORF type:complete len:532 (+),score=146.73 gnl/TRDRNA2_/TRDRNA2_151591_c0_seq1:65-1660(+)
MPRVPRLSFRPLFGGKKDQSVKAADVERQLPAAKLPAAARLAGDQLPSLDDVEWKVEELWLDRFSPLREMLSHKFSNELLTLVEDFLAEARQSVQNLQELGEICSLDSRPDLEEEVSRAVQECQVLHDLAERWKNGAVPDNDAGADRQERFGEADDKERMRDQLDQEAMRYAEEQSARLAEEEEAARQLRDSELRQVAEDSELRRLAEDDGAPGPVKGARAAVDVEAELEHARANCLAPLREILSHGFSEEMAAVADALLEEARAAVERLQEKGEECAQLDRCDLVAQIAAVASEAHEIREHVDRWRKTESSDGASAQTVAAPRGLASDDASLTHRERLLKEHDQRLREQAQKEHWLRLEEDAAIKKAEQELALRIEQATKRREDAERQRQSEEAAEKLRWQKVHEAEEEDERKTRAEEVKRQKAEWAEQYRLERLQAEEVLLAGEKDKSRKEKEQPGEASLHSRPSDPAPEASPSRPLLDASDEGKGGASDVADEGKGGSVKKASRCSRVGGCCLAGVRTLCSSSKAAAK